jgi:DNA-binding response OmpR family regulator
MVKSKTKAIRSLTQEKVVNIGDYRHLKTGQSLKKLAVLGKNKDLFEALKKDLDGIAELIHYDSPFSLEKASKAADWDGLLIDERELKDEAIPICEKLKKSSKFEDSFIVIISDDSAKDRVREGYEKGVDEWITRLESPDYLAKLLSHHLKN